MLEKFRSTIKHFEKCLAYILLTLALLASPQVSSANPDVNGGKNVPPGSLLHRSVVLLTTNNYLNTSRGSGVFYGDKIITAGHMFGESYARSGDSIDYKNGLPIRYTRGCNDYFQTSGSTITTEVKKNALKLCIPIIVINSKYDSNALRVSEHDTAIGCLDQNPDTSFFNKVSFSEIDVNNDTNQLIAGYGNGSTPGRIGQYFLTSASVTNTTLPNTTLRNLHGSNNERSENGDSGGFNGTVDKNTGKVIIYGVISGNDGIGTFAAIIPEYLKDIDCSELHKLAIQYETRSKGRVAFTVTADTKNPNKLKVHSAYLHESGKKPNQIYYATTYKSNYPNCFLIVSDTSYLTIPQFLNPQYPSKIVKNTSAQVITFSKGWTTPDVSGVDYYIEKSTDPSCTLAELEVSTTELHGKVASPENPELSRDIQRPEDTSTLVVGNKYKVYLTFLKKK